MAAFGGNQEQKAQDYMEEGEKILKKSKWSLFGSATKHEDAAEWFEKAARCLKIARKMEESAAMSERAAEQFSLVKSHYQAASSYVEAAKCRKTFDPVTSVETFKKAIEIYSETGRFLQAGKMLTEVGDIYQAAGEFHAAVEALQEATQYFVDEGSTSQANACLIKVAGMISKDIDPPDLGRAAEIYEQLGRSCMEKKLLQMNAKSYWLQAGLALLAQGDTVAAKTKIDNFLTTDYTFDGSREFRFVMQLITASEDFDVEGFSQHCFEYDQISKLDPWKTSMCLRIKRKIDEGAGHNEEGDGDEDIDLT